MNSRGFTLVELIAVIALIAIALGIGTLNFNEWNRKYNIEAQTKEIMTDLTNVRLMSIQTKKRHQVVLNPTSYSIRSYSSEFDTVGTQVFNKTLKHQISRFSSGAVTVFSNFSASYNDRGYTSNLFTIAVAPGVTGPALNCVTVHTARVNLGRINGNNCEYQ